MPPFAAWLSSGSEFYFAAGTMESHMTNQNTLPASRRGNRSWAFGCPNDHVQNKWAPPKLPVKKLLSAGLTSELRSLRGHWLVGRGLRAKNVADAVHRDMPEHSGCCSGAYNCGCFAHWRREMPISRHVDMRADHARSPSPACTPADGAAAGMQWSDMYAPEPPLLQRRSSLCHRVRL